MSGLTPEQLQADAARYQFLRDVFAVNADNDEAEFSKLAHLTGKAFDEAVDRAMWDAGCAYKTPNLKILQAECDAFNKANPVGANVFVKLDGCDELFPTTTRSEAQILSGHSAVIWLIGVIGCYLLECVTPRSAA